MLHIDPFRAGELLLARAAPPCSRLYADIALLIGGSPAMQSLCCRILAEAPTFPALLEAHLPTPDTYAPLRLRLRVIRFADIYMDAAPFRCSAFEPMPPHGTLLRTQLTAPLLQGSSPRKSALEALHLAMLGRWQRIGDTRRHIVAIITDSPAYLPEEPQRHIDPAYPAILAAHAEMPPEPMPHTMDALRRQWRDGTGTMDNWNSRLLLIAPSDTPWLQMARWPRTAHFVHSGDALDRLTADDLFRMIGQVI